MKAKAISALNWYLEEPFSSYWMLLAKILLIPMALVVVAIGLLAACIACALMIFVFMPLAIFRDSLEEGW